MQNAVYIRLVVYVLSAVLGLIPAVWAGWISYNDVSQVLEISIPGAATAIISGLAVTGGIFAKWGTK